MRGGGEGGLPVSGFLSEGSAAQSAAKASRRAASCIMQARRQAVGLSSEGVLFIDNAYAAYELKGKCSRGIYICRGLQPAAQHLVPAFAACCDRSGRRCVRQLRHGEGGGLRA